MRPQENNPTETDLAIFVNFLKLKNGLCHCFPLFEIIEKTYIKCLIWSLDEKISSHEDLPPHKPAKLVLAVQIRFESYFDMICKGSRLG